MAGLERPGAEAGGGPRVTKESIEAKIADVIYEHVRGSTVMICIITMANGFSVIGESACADPDNFDAELGRNLAYAKAFEKLWPLEGYLLREQMHIDQQLQEALS